MYVLSFTAGDARADDRLSDETTLDPERTLRDKTSTVLMMLRSSSHSTRRNYISRWSPSRL